MANARKSRATRIGLVGRDESGQALVLVLLVILLLALLAPVIVGTVTNTSSIVGGDVDYQAALAAAQAGVQQYRNDLDVETNYWQYGPNNLPPSGDAAMTKNGWQFVKGTTPAEYFHYLPNSSLLPTQQGSQPAEIVLTVTGRAGPASNPTYRTIQVTFQSTGLLTDAYFSQYEVLDKSQDTAAVTVTVNGNVQCTTCTPNSVTLPAAVPSNEGPTQNLWIGLCEYDDWQPNLFIDTLGVHNPYAGGTYNSSTPYYGPWRGWQPDQPKSAANTTFSYTSGTTNISVFDPCNGIYNFLGGESFTGPVYTDDQLWICNPNEIYGAGPTFSRGVEVGGMPAGGYTYAYPQWPAQPSANNPGWIDNADISAYGWDQSCEDTAIEPTPSVGQSFGSLGVRPVAHEQPQDVDEALLSQAQVAGCVYKGPTIIEFTGANGSTFNVWSPESVGQTTSYGGDSCGTFSASGGGTGQCNTTAYFCTGLSIPAGGLLIYVDSLPGTTSTQSLATGVSEGAVPNSAAPLGTATCLNPWKPYSPLSGASVPGQLCKTVSREGDAIVEGEVKGQVTLAAQNSIVVSRDITYACADSAGAVSGQASTTYQLPSGCNTESTPDILGLVANQDVVIGHPATSAQVDPSGDDDVPAQTEPYEWPTSTVCAEDGTAPTQGITYAIPDCDLGPAVIDAALVALKGSYGAEEWDLGLAAPSGWPASDANSWVQGTDVGEYRGPFGESPYGYSKHFTYDTRLQYLTPPDMALVAGLTWNAFDYTDCGGVNDGSQTNPSASGVCPSLATSR